MWSLYEPIHVKSWPKRNWVKLKSVQTLLIIACLGDRRSYVVIICANSCEKSTKRKSYVVIICVSSCEKFTKSEIYSDIAQNHFHISQFDLWRSSKVKGHPIKKSWGQLKDHIHVYDFLYVFQVNCGHDMHHSEDTAHLKTQLYLIWPLKVIQGQR